MIRSTWAVVYEWVCCSCLIWVSQIQRRAWREVPSLSASIASLPWCKILAPVRCPSSYQPVVTTQTLERRMDVTCTYIASQPARDLGPCTPRLRETGGREMWPDQLRFGLTCLHPHLAKAHPTTTLFTRDPLSSESKSSSESLSYIVQFLARPVSQLMPIGTFPLRCSGINACRLCVAAAATIVTFLVLDCHPTAPATVINVC